MISAQAALERLKQGNRRFILEMQSPAEQGETRARRLELATAQSPFAIILGCSDSRVPAEIVFDQGLGDLFVIRVAGNIVAPSQVGSVEFAAAKFGTPLVVVLGHSSCGAVQATLEEYMQPMEQRSPNLSSIVDRVMPSLEALLLDDPHQPTAVLLDRAVRANIETSVHHLRHGSEILENLIAKEQLMIVGAEYSLETGRVEFFDHPGDPER